VSWIAIANRGVPEHGNPEIRVGLSLKKVY
jgi:hypothetical protein